MNSLIFDLCIYSKLFISLFALVNPIGMIPVFTSITSHQSIDERNKTNFITNYTVFIILSATLFLGRKILDVFGVSMNAFRISGGILIINIAMSMINGNLIKKMEQDRNSKQSSNSSENIGVIPLAMPLIAGPGAISSTIMWSAQCSNVLNLVFSSMVIAFFSFFCWLLFKTAPFVVEILGKTGINVVTRIMGLLLMALGIEFVTSGIRSIFPGLAQIACI